MIRALDKEKLSQSISNLEAWLETMRGPDGYYGPISHWWKECILYCGSGIDWRYEGIICGYLNLFKKTGVRRWLDKAVRSADDAVLNQLSNSMFLNSSFELNPDERASGSPHGAGIDIGLLNLAGVLKEMKNTRWVIYQKAAEKNIKEVIINLCWNPTLKTFINMPYISSFFQRKPQDFTIYIPNKIATIIEAILLLIRFTKENELIDKYCIPAASHILKLQISEKNSPLHGAIRHSNRISDSFTFYTARCVPALLELHQVTGNEKYYETAHLALEFVKSMADRDGGFYQVRYRNGGMGKYPMWVAGCGDILRALLEFGSSFNLNHHINWIFQNQDSIGGIRTAYGFAVKGLSRDYNGLPDFRDILHVCGWNDKAFRFLTLILSEGEKLPEPNIEESEIQCRSKKYKKCSFNETVRDILLKDLVDNKVLFKWRKGNRWPSIFAIN